MSCLLHQSDYIKLFTVQNKEIAVNTDSKRKFVNLTHFFSEDVCWLERDIRDFQFAFPNQFPQKNVYGCWSSSVKFVNIQNNITAWDHCYFYGKLVNWFLVICIILDNQEQSQKRIFEKNKTLQFWNNSNLRILPALEKPGKHFLV